MRKEQVILKDHPNPAVTERQIHAAARIKKRDSAELDPALIGHEQAGDQSQEGRLARTEGPKMTPISGPILRLTSSVNS